MAPRVRPRKPRLTRMDAAIDAMRPLGFPEELVRTRVKDILKEYGGDDGWVFMEADAYKLLIDTILDEQEDGVVAEERNEDENILLNGSLVDDRPEDCSIAADPGPSTLAFPPISPVVADAAALTIETGRDHPLIAEGDREGSDDPGELDTIAKGGDGSGGGMYIDNAPILSSPSLIRPQPPANGDGSGGLHIDNAPVLSSPSLIRPQPPASGDGSGGGLHIDNALVLSSPSLIRPQPPANGDGSGGGLHIDNAPVLSSPSLIRPQPPANGDGSGGGMHIDNPPVPSSPSLIRPQPPANGLQKRRRKPCYGWISSGDEEDDFIELKPAPRLNPAKAPGQQENGISRTEKRRLRKSNWDVKL